MYFENHVDPDQLASDGGYELAVTTHVVDWLQSLKQFFINVS